MNEEIFSRILKEQQEVIGDLMAIILRQKNKDENEVNDLIHHGIKVQNKALKVMVKELEERLERLTQETSTCCDCEQNNPFSQYLIELANEVAHNELSDEYKLQVLYAFTDGLKEA